MYRLPLKFHHEVVRSDIVELADVRMIERSDGASLSLKAFTELGLGDFDRDNTIEACVAGLVLADLEAPKSWITAFTGSWARFARVRRLGRRLVRALLRVHGSLEMAARAAAGVGLADRDS
jgi:hypothetical protein